MSWSFLENRPRRRPKIDFFSFLKFGLLNTGTCSTNSQELPKKISALKLKPLARNERFSEPYYPPKWPKNPFFGFSGPFDIFLLKIFVFPMETGQIEAPGSIAVGPSSVGLTVSSLWTVECCMVEIFDFFIL